MRDQTRLPCEFGANPFRYFIQKQQTDGTKNRTLRSFTSRPTIERDLGN